MSEWPDEFPEDDLDDEALDAIASYVEAGLARKRPIGLVILHDGSACDHFKYRYAYMDTAESDMYSMMMDDLDNLWSSGLSQIDFDDRVRDIIVHPGWNVPSFNGIFRMHDDHTVVRIVTTEISAGCCCGDCDR